jgi:EAL domain-containing protein (putative c-di-GMP-specific phosphodiesterase class I)
VYPQDGDNTDLLLQKADMAMYAAKEDRKGSFRFCDDQLYARLKQRLETENELGRAIIEDQFIIHYQPRVDAFSGKLVGLEALVRWQHPQRGLVPPLEFISLAESTGAIVPLGALVLKKVFAQLATWKRDGEIAVPVSVNVSPRQFNEGRIDRLIAELLAEYGLKAELIEIEVTESAMMNDSAEIAQQVAAINALGVQMHLDDFGTGYSSLARLQELNMNVLKVDRAFTARLGKSRSGETLFKSIVSMAKALDMRIVAEGVETLEQLRLLRSYGCDEAQGYFISKPLPCDEVLALIRKQYLLPDRQPEQVSA